MTFASPQYLLLLAALPLAVGAVYWAVRSREAALARIGNPDLVRRLTASVNTRGRLTASALTIAALGLAILALARPQWGESMQVVERRGIQMMVAIDVSKSMLAEDVRPNRLARAKLEVFDLMRLLRGDEMGLALFAGSAFVQFPLTFDFATARAFLEYAGPDAIRRQGTAMEQAIRVSMRGLADDQPSQKVILIVSDGEEQEGDAVSAAREAAESGVVVYTLGIGTAEGEPIPTTDRFGNDAGYLQDKQGNVVLSRIDEQTLQAVAEAGGGKYIRGGDGINAAEQIAVELSQLQRTTMEHELESIRVERFQLFAGAAIALLIVGELVSARRRDAARGAAA